MVRRKETMRKEWIPPTELQTIIIEQPDASIMIGHPCYIQESKTVIESNPPSITVAPAVVVEQTARIEINQPITLISSHNQYYQSTWGNICGIIFACGFIFMLFALFTFTK